MKSLPTHLPWKLSNSSKLSGRTPRAVGFYIDYPTSARSRASAWPAGRLRLKAERSRRHQGGGQLQEVSTKNSHFSSFLWSLSTWRGKFFAR